MCLILLRQILTHLTFYHNPRCSALLLFMFTDREHEEPGVHVNCSTLGELRNLPSVTSDSVPLGSRSSPASALGCMCL